MTAVWLSLPTLGIVLAGGCGPIELGHISPLAGNWRGINSPGAAFVGTVVFDYSGHMDSLEIRGKDRSLTYRFDGQLHPDSAGQQYTATATTTITGNEFRVKAYIEYAGGEHEGLTWIIVEGRVQYGSMSGTVTVAFPDSDAISHDFTATRS